MHECAPAGWESREDAPLLPLSDGRMICEFILAVAPGNYNHDGILAGNRTRVWRYRYRRARMDALTMGRFQRRRSGYASVRAREHCLWNEGIGLINLLHMVPGGNCCPITTIAMACDGCGPWSIRLLARGRQKIPASSRSSVRRRTRAQVLQTPLQVTPTPLGQRQRSRTRAAHLLSQCPLPFTGRGGGPRRSERWRETGRS